MKRRRFLATATLAGLAGVAGCTGPDESPILPDGMAVETRHWVADVLATDFRDRRTDDGGVPPAVVLADPTEARTRLDSDDRSDGGDGLRGFVRDTDFERSYLLVVQYGMQSAPRLELRLVERTDAGLDVEVEVDDPTGSYVDDWVVHSLVIRVTDERAGVPREVEVTVDR